MKQVLKPGARKIYYQDGNALNNTRTNLSLTNVTVVDKVSHCEATTPNGEFFLFDKCDLITVNSRPWFIGKLGYVTSAGANFYFHRLVLDVEEGRYVDHINLNRTDNRRLNLRVCTNGQNQSNRPKARVRNSTSIYKGVSLNHENSWGVRVKRKRYGYYSSEIAAANVYNYFAKQEFGDFAKLNDVKFMSLAECDVYKNTK
jgi:hypothetical protein